MSYVTQSDLTARFSRLQLWTDDAAAGAVNATVVAECIALADGEINGALAQQYTLPLRLADANTAALLRDVAGALAGYKLASRIWETIPENLRKQYEDAQSWLALVRQGKVALGGESPAAIAKPAGGIVVAGGSAVIDRLTMDGL